MKTLDWPPNFVARCPVRLFEAPGGGSSWMPSGTAGEFHMKPLGNAELHFQLRDLLDNQILFEYTMHKPDAFLVLTQRFFVIRLENGSFRGFGFADIASANEMKKQVEKAVKPYHIKESVNGNLIKASLDDVEMSISHMNPEATTSSNKNFSKVITYDSVPKRSKGVNKRRKDSMASSSVPSFEMTTFNASSKSGSLRSKWKLVLKGFITLSPIKKLNAMSQVFGWRDQEMEIGYPTDVKHVAHIGWDGPSVGGPNWVDELKPAPDFSSGPLREFGQPRDADWIHDAFSASKWSTPGLGEKFNTPPGAPAEFLGPDKAQLDQKGGYKWSLFSARKASKSIQKTQSGTYT